jgi:hypothetical protein
VFGPVLGIQTFSEGNLRLYRRLGYEEVREQEVSPRLRQVYLEKARGRPAPAGRPEDPPA